MPFMDGTGPLGEGPGSGRGRGMCAGAQRGFGRGLGLGRDAGRGRRFRQQRASGAELGERAALEHQASFLERQLDRIKQRLSSLGSGGEERK